MSQLSEVQDFTSRFSGLTEKRYGQGKRYAPKLKLLARYIRPTNFPHEFASKHARNYGRIILRFVVRAILS